MKVIGKTEHDYICEVSHHELEKFMNLYYNKLNKLKIGDQLDLATGYDFETKTLNALKKTEDFISANKEVVEAILNGISVIAKSNLKETKV